MINVVSLSSSVSLSDTSLTELPSSTEPHQTNTVPPRYHHPLNHTGQTRCHQATIIHSTTPDKHSPTDYTTELPSPTQPHRTNPVPPSYHHPLNHTGQTQCHRATITHSTTPDKHSATELPSSTQPHQTNTVPPSYHHPLNHTGQTQCHRVSE